MPSFLPNPPVIPANGQPNTQQYLYRIEIPSARVARAVEKLVIYIPLCHKLRHQQQLSKPPHATGLRPLTQYHLK